MAETTASMRGALAAAALLIAAPAAAAEPVAEGLSDDGARVSRLAENVYVIEHDDATDEWPHGNTGVIVGPNGVFVIDSCYLPSRARADIALIRRITDKPVRYLMTTHWHFDHNNGAVDRTQPALLEGALHRAGFRPPRLPRDAAIGAHD